MRTRPFQPESYPLVGGLDLVTIPAMVTPGRVLAGVNFEPNNNGGYTKMSGLERYDGRPRPSDATYAKLAVIITGTIVAGQTVTGSTSGATAEVVAVLDTETLLITKITGTFGLENFTVSAVVQGSIIEYIDDTDYDPRSHAIYGNWAADNYRDDIGLVPGSGPIRGVRYYQGVLYAWRNNADGTQCIMHRATTNGWTALTFGKEIQFDAAVGQINEGDTVTGGTSGAIGVVTRALLRTGTWTSAGVGTLVFDVVTGTFIDNELLKVATVTKATANGASSSITLLPGGKFEFESINFFGGTTTERLYCADGVNKLGEFDGIRWVPIRTGSTVDKPLFVKEHRKHLIVAISSSLMVSGIGQPYSWTALTGAAELTTGQHITGLSNETGDANTGALLILTAERCYMLYGTSVADFNLVLHSPQSGGKSYTVQNLGFSHFLSTRGVTQLIASQTFGNFQTSVLTQDIQPLIDEKRGHEIASCVIRNTNQYWIFFNDGSGIIMQVKQGQGGATIGATMMFDYGESLVMNVVHSYVDANGIDRVMAGATNGYVYELNRGTSLDGESMRFHLMLHFNHSKSIRVRKNYKRTVLHVSAEGYAEMKVGYDLGFGKRSISQTDHSSRSVPGRGGFWDSFVFNNFVFDTPSVDEIHFKTAGNGDSIAIIVSGDSEVAEQFTLQTCVTYFRNNRMER